MKRKRFPTGRISAHTQGMIYLVNTLDKNKIAPGYLVWDKTDNLWKYKDEKNVIHNIGGTAGTNPDNPVFVTLATTGNANIGGDLTVAGKSTFNSGTLTTPSANFVGQTTSPPDPATGNSGIYFDQTANTFKRWNPVTKVWEGLGAGTDPTFNSLIYTPTTPAPSTPTEGMTYYDVDKGLQIWNGANWISLDLQYASNYPTWTVTDSYKAGQIILYKNMLYTAKTDIPASATPPDQDSTNWDFFVGASGLEKITEGGKSGWALIGVSRGAKKANIGLKAVDLSIGASSQPNKGATGDYSFASGYYTLASGARSAAFGAGSIASGMFSLSVGASTTAS